ncbi:MAG: hypothetical protein WDZ86_06610 [Gammaproteobacteria bacterium]
MSLTGVTHALPVNYELEFDQLEHADLALEQVQIKLVSDHRHDYTLSLQAAHLFYKDQTVKNTEFSEVHVDCQATLENNIVYCHAGELRLQHVTLGRLNARMQFRYHLQDGLQELALENLALANGRVNVRFDNNDQINRWQLDLQTLDIAALHDVMAGFGLSAPAGVDVDKDSLQGELSAEMTLQGDPEQAFTARLSLTNFHFTDGNNVAQAVDLQGKFSATLDAEHWQGQTQWQLLKGELYVLPLVDVFTIDPGFYIAIDKEPLVMHSHFDWQPATQNLLLTDFQYAHPEVLALTATAVIDLAGDKPLRLLNLQVPAFQLAQAFPVYLEPLLINTAFNELNVSGTAGVELRWQPDGLESMALLLDAVSIDDGRERFTVNGLSTDMQVAAGQTGRTTLHWQEIDIYRLAFGAGRIGFASDGLNLQITDWQDVDILEGSLRIDQLDMQALGSAGFSLHMAGGLQDASVVALTRTLGWPAFGGDLSGDFSGLRYSQGQLRMDGELQLQLFGGQVRMTDLEILDLFGPVPRLAANVMVKAIDLERLTDTFAFGKITGKLSGHVSGLQLEDWQPVAFTAELSTRPIAGVEKVRHRISQRALNNISQIGGGLSGALSRGFLSYFDEYSYGELGISCRLSNGICELGGVDRFADGHYLLTRGGLFPPWVEVKLNGTMIGWEALIRGFQNIAEGEIQIQ